MTTTLTSADSHAGAGSTTWRCWWQDYTGWRERNQKQKRPEKNYKDFRTEEEAARFKVTIRTSPAIVAHVEKRG